MGLRDLSCSCSGKHAARRNSPIRQWRGGGGELGVGGSTMAMWRLGVVVKRAHSLAAAVVGSTERRTAGQQQRPAGGDSDLQSVAPFYFLIPSFLFLKIWLSFSPKRSSAKPTRGSFFV